MKENVKIILAPTKELAETVHADATVEAEYGDYCVEGKIATMAHHGSRSFNPAPCNTETPPLDVSKPQTILISHIDLDTMGGIMALTGEKPYDPSFWAAAEKIDVQGQHHSHELLQIDKEKMDAFHAWVASQPKAPRYTELTDVTQSVQERMDVIKAICDERHPSHKQLIDDGIKWDRETAQSIESKLVAENREVRAFQTDGVFCSASYYSPKQNVIVPATVSYNERFKSITIAFEDGGKQHSACQIAQAMWGPAAGGRDGIAGSPRGQAMDYEDFKMAARNVRDVMIGKIRVEDIKPLGESRALERERDGFER